MFTGIIEELGAVESLEPRAAGARLRVLCSRVTGGMTVGSSIASHRANNSDARRRTLANA